MHKLCNIPSFTLVVGVVVQGKMPVTVNHADTKTPEGAVSSNESSAGWFIRSENMICANDRKPEVLQAYRVTEKEK